MKNCRCCNVVKVEHDFYRSKYNIYTGVQAYHNMCKECYKYAAKERYYLSIGFRLDDNGVPERM